MRNCGSLRSVRKHACIYICDVIKHHCSDNLYIIPLAIVLLDCECVTLLCNNASASSHVTVAITFLFFRSSLFPTATNVLCYENFNFYNLLCILVINKLNMIVLIILHLTLRLYIIILYGLRMEMIVDVTYIHILQAK